MLRTNKIPLDKRLVGLEMKLPAPIEGEVIWNGSEARRFRHLEHRLSYSLGKAVMLGWLDLVDGELAGAGDHRRDAVAQASVETPFYDPDG